MSSLLLKRGGKNLVTHRVPSWFWPVCAPVGKMGSVLCLKTNEGIPFTSSVWDEVAVGAGSQRQAPLSLAAQSLTAPSVMVPCC